MSTQIIRELEAIRDAHNGVLEPKDVEAWVRRNACCRLHAVLTWDDRLAMEKHREHLQG